MRITEELKKQVKDIPIESVFSWLGIAGRRSGKWFNVKGDKSLKADTQRNTYIDFSSKHGKGDVISLVMEFTGHDFKTAVEMLASNFLGYVLEHKPPLPQVKKPAEAKPTASKQYIPQELAVKYFARYERNNLAVYAASLLRLPMEQVAATFARYRTGTAKNGETAFFYCDRAGRYEHVKLFEYNAAGKRQKTYTPKPYTTENGYCRSGLFGAHLLADEPDKLVLIVEGEKTAILAALYLPNLLPIATGGKENLKPEYYAALQGRRVIVLPDADARQDWKEITAAMRTSGINARYLDLCPTRDDKSDLADYIAEAMTAGETAPQWLERLQTMIDSFQPHNEPLHVPQAEPKTNFADAFRQLDEIFDLHQVRFFVNGKMVYDDKQALLAYSKADYPLLLSEPIEPPF